MKVFIRTAELERGDKPKVIAFYPDEAAVKPDAHGGGTTVLTLPNNTVIRDDRRKGGSGMYVLADNWRELAGSMPVEAEAKRRVDDVLPLTDQVDRLRETIDLIISHGVDQSKWPPEANQRKADFDARLRYVNEVRERARSQSTTAASHEISSDKFWPRRPSVEAKK